MPDLDFLVPSALVDSALAADLLRDQACPNLERLVSHAGPPEVLTMTPDAPLATWQAWVFGTRAGVSPEKVNIAELWAMACGIAPSTRPGRFLVEPAHFTIAKDHLRLDDPRRLGITLTEARALIAAIEPLLIETGWRLHPVEPATLTHWPIARDDGAALSAASIERAIGGNVAAWQPRMIDGARVDGGDDAAAALAWRRCVNEIQMTWFDHPVNDAREADGRPTINTLWLSGNGRMRTALPHYAAIDCAVPLLAALPIDPRATRSLEAFDGFVDVSRDEDWSGWREQLGHLDARLEQIDASERGRTVTIALCGQSEVKVITIAPGDRGKFWRGWGRKPSLVELFGEASRA